MACLRADEPQFRHRQTGLLVWYQRVINGLDEAQTTAFLNRWIDQNHNNLSKDYLKNPRAVYRENERISAAFDFEKVGRGVGTVAKNLQRFQAHTATLRLTAEQADLLARILCRAENSGEKQRKYTLVAIPSKTLQTWQRNYSRVLKSLVKMNYLSVHSQHSEKLRLSRVFCVKYSLP